MERKYSNFPEAYIDLVYTIQRHGVMEETRNGPAFVFPHPVLLTIYDSMERVVSDPVRNANHFFHVMETVWMFAGHSDPRWLEPFNKRIMEYADIGPVGTPIINGAYGYRWRRHWFDQIPAIISMISTNPNTRQAVLNMWDPHCDLNAWAKDRPCNTHIYFRVRFGELDMTICNRSNDLVWGMMGANAVHMSYLHEFMARALGLEVGLYHVMSNNLHFYTEVYPNGKDILNRGDVMDTVYPARIYPILRLGEDWGRFLLDCKLFCDGKFDQIKSSWLLEVALPMRRVYLKEPGADYGDIAAEDWRTATSQWLSRNRQNATL